MAEHQDAVRLFHDPPLGLRDEALVCRIALDDLDIGSKLADLALLYSPGNTALHSALGDCLATWDVLAALCRYQSRAIARRAFNGSACDVEELTLRHLFTLS
ncbi:hypothetical protein ABZS83_04790 [Streptomyces sp. NPDC005426]|uniref:hypothetical protein n=1 Tax=Streptomyces sp. NPDC005426 TaxID=3155344 RepID=UPI0033B5AEE9